MRNKNKQTTVVKHSSECLSQCQECTGLYTDTMGFGLEIECQCRCHNEENEK
jgi:hypothetical protein